MQKIPSDTRKDKLRRLKALVIKEFYQIMRDPSSLLISIFLPLLLMFLYGFGISLDLNHLRFGLVLEDTAPEARSLAESFTNSRYFDVKVVRDRREILDDIERGTLRGFAVIPSYFSAFRFRRDAVAPVLVIADGSEPNTANFVQNYARGAYQAWLNIESISNDLKGLPQVSAQTRFWYNEQLESRDFIIPGSLALIMTLIGTLLTALVVAREWERGTMEALLSTPVTKAELILGKFIPYFTLGMVSMSICVFLAVTMYGVPLRGSILLLGLVTSVFLYCALGIGLMLSTVSRNQVMASQLAILSGFYPAYMLSGFLFEITSMPTWVQFFSYLVPARYFVQSLQTLFLVGNVWTLILWNLVPMLLLGSISYFVIIRKTVKRLD